MSMRHEVRVGDTVRVHVNCHVEIQVLSQPVVFPDKVITVIFAVQIDGNKYPVGPADGNHCNCNDKLSQNLK